MYKLGLKLWSINTDFYYEEAQKLYAQGIFDYIELYVVPNTLNTLQKWKELNIPFIIHAPHHAHKFNLAKTERKEFNLKIYTEVKQFADELKAQYIVFHGGVDGSIDETARQLASFNEPRALIENKPCITLSDNKKYCRGYCIDEIKKVISVANCGFCLDIGHAICAANSQKLDIYEYCKNFLKLEPNMYHLTDIKDITSPYDTHLHIGTGELDLKRIFEMIPDEKSITVETIKNSKENLNDFVNDAKMIKFIMEE